MSGLLGSRGRERRVGLLAIVLMAFVGAHGQAQEPVATLPNNYKLVLDNSEVSVIRTHYAPHEKIPVHDHPALSTLFVFLNDGGAVKVERPDDPAATLTRPPQVKGEFRVAGAAAERHSVENMGDTSSDFLRIELKQVPLAMKEPFIGKAPASTGATVDALEFTDVGLMVERILCVGPAVCPVKLTTFPSLIVALSPLTLTEGGEKGEKMPAGGVHWLNAAQEVSVVAPDAAGTAHLLRVVFPPMPAK